LVAVGFADFSLIAYHFQKDLPGHRHIGPRFLFRCYGCQRARFSWFWAAVRSCRYFNPGGAHGHFGAFCSAGLSRQLLVNPDRFGALGLGMGVHESIIPAAVALMVPRTRRPSAYGTFTSIYGVAWFVGSAITGIFYDRSIPAVILFCVACQLAAIPIFLSVRKQLACGGQPPS